MIQNVKQAPHIGSIFVIFHGAQHSLASSCTGAGECEGEREDFEQLYLISTLTLTLQLHNRGHAVIVPSGNMASPLSSCDVRLPWQAGPVIDAGGLFDYARQTGMIQMQA